MPQPDPSGIRPRPRTSRAGTPLDKLLTLAVDPAAVSHADLNMGDTVMVTTRNSTYALCTLGQNRFAVSGGWFEQNGGGPQVAQVNGCTWGGSAIRHDLVASPGLFLEFSNGVRTTRIHSVRVIPSPDHGSTH